MAAESERVLRWRDGRLVPGEGAAVRLLAADSFLVSDGEVVALDRHRERFLSSVRSPAVAALAASPVPEHGDAFWSAAMTELPTRGAWFPRIELADSGDGARFAVRVRRAPPLGTTVTVTTWTGDDPRRIPAIKGPDLEALLQARAAVLPTGAAEAVLLSPDGLVCDGTTSAIVWWDGETLCLPPSALPRVDSVTVRCVAALAASAGTALRAVARRPDELAGREVWMLNALHGIRRVDAWLDGPAVGGHEEGRLEVWRRRLSQLRRPVGASAAPY